MKIQSENEFGKLRDHVRSYLHKFPEFKNDVRQLEDIIEKHIKEYSQALVKHRQTKSRYHLEEAQKHIESINKTVAMVEKIELMAYLSQR
jgi:thiamine kinase-like enzyme